MPAPLFFKVAQRLVHYDGAVTAALRIAADAVAPVQAPAQPSPSRPAAAQPVQDGRGDLGPLVNGIRAPKGAQVVTLAELAAQHPDLIGLSKVG